jgi:integrase
VSERARRWRESSLVYESELERERITVRHRRECVRVVRNVGELLEAEDLSCDPRFFGDPQLNFLLEGPWRNLRPNGKAYNFCLLNRFLKTRNNTTVERARLRFDRTPQRPKLALNREERVRLLDSARRAGIVPYGMIVLMLTMGLRPSEVRRLTVEQATSDPVVFIGKQKGIEQGFGKVRRVPPHPLFREVLPELLAHRQQLVSDWSGEDPGFLFCRIWNGKLGKWGKAWMDRHFIAPVFEDANVHAPFNLNYRARRTFGRVARLEQNHPIEKVARLMGHTDSRTTVQYLGLTEDDDRAVIDSTRDSYGTQLAAPAEERQGGRIGHAG